MKICPTKQSQITALCAYTKGFEDCASLLFGASDGELIATTHQIRQRIERKLRAMQSAPDGDSRKIAAAALSPVLVEIFDHLAAMHGMSRKEPAHEPEIAEARQVAHSKGQPRDV